MNDDDTNPRANAVQALQDEDHAEASQGSCGTEPEKPTYYSTQAVRDRWMAWKLCAAGVASRGATPSANKPDTGGLGIG